MMMRNSVQHCVRTCCSRGLWACSGECPCEVQKGLCMAHKAVSDGTQLLSLVIPLRLKFSRTS